MLNRSQARKKYVGVTYDANGKIKRDNEDKKIVREKGKKKFFEWSRKNFIRY